jgi:signal transduction histidine kinase
MYLDIGLAVVALFVILITHINRPKNARATKKWHAIAIQIYVLLHLAWASGISIIEASSALGLPTYLLGVFSAAIIFIIPAIPFMIYLAASILSIIIGLILNGTTMEQMVVNYAPLIVLVVIAWITSRILYNTRLNSFAETKKLEIARNNLDITVKERTRELRDTNEKLKEEIRERKRYAKRLEIEKKKAEDADKLKSVFLANMSHEIRTPLNGILGFSDLLQNANLSQEKKERYFEIIHNNGQQLVKIIDDIMDISMIESNQLKINPACFRISHILPDALSYFINYRRVINKDQIELINEGFDSTGNDQVLSDPLRVQQVLYNLLGNALKFTAQGQVRFGAKYDSGFIMVYVEDTGIGIDPEMCEKIFERFRQGEESISRSYGGTGLGLSISKGIIEMMGGMIWVDFSYNLGARFCFSLPTVEIEEYSNIDGKKSEFMDLLSARDIIITSSTKAEFSALNYYLKCSKSPIKITDADHFSVDKLKAEPEIAIVDLPGNITMNKYICNELRKRHSRTKVISIFKPIPEVKKELLELGCTTVFTDPLNIQLLLEYIRKLVIGRS